MDMIPPDLEQLWNEARRYEEGGDPYHAVKLYKRLTRLAPDWFQPFLRLGLLYHGRREWKPAFHYFKKTVALAPDCREAWWSLGIAATAQKKWHIARSVWSKFGLQELPRHPEGLRLTYDGTFEILWMQPLDPARAQVLSIPHPASGYHYRDVMLYERKPIGHHIVNKRRVPVYAEMGLFKHSPFQTFSCLLHTNRPSDIQQLERLCHTANLGFEVWSNASRSMVMEHPQAFPEYYSRNMLPPDQEEADHNQCLVAIAALHEAQVQRVLNDWQIISLQQYSDLRAY